MLRPTYTCDFRKKSYMLSPHGHANHVKNNDKKSTVKGHDVIGFPPNWIGVGVNIMCDDCLKAVQEEVSRAYLDAK